MRSIKKKILHSSIENDKYINLLDIIPDLVSNDIVNYVHNILAYEKIDDI